MHIYTCMYVSLFSCSVVSDSLQSHGLQHTRLPCPSPTSGVYSNSCPLSQWCHPTVSSSVIPFSSCFQSFPASGSFPISQFFASGGHSIRISASASVLPVNIPSSQETRNNIGRSFNQRMAYRLQTSLPAGRNWAVKDSRATPGISLEIVQWGQMMSAGG